LIGGGRNAPERADPFKAFYAKLRNAGKPAKLALIALARKLLTILNAMMRDRKPIGLLHQINRCRLQRLNADVPANERNRPP